MAYTLNVRWYLIGVGALDGPLAGLAAPARDSFLMKSQVRETRRVMLLLLGPRPKFFGIDGVPAPGNKSKQPN